MKGDNKRETKKVSLDEKVKNQADSKKKKSTQVKSQIVKQSGTKKDQPLKPFIGTIDDVEEF